MDPIIQNFFQLECQLRLYHWNTTSFARHKASDEAIGHVVTSMDRIIETLLGQKDRTSIIPPQIEMKFQTLSDEGILTYLDLFIDYLKRWESKEVLNSTDILNLRDELLGHINQVKYLMTLA